MAEGQALGERMHSLGMVLRGELSQAQWKEFLADVAQAIGMNAVGDPACWTYPVDGKGGNGQTIVLPITESFLALDTWPDHRGAYLFVCSCRNFDPAVVEATAAVWDLKVGHNGSARFTAELHLT